MPLRRNRACLMLGLFLAGDVWALGLGDIRLSSALNEPLRAEIGLLSATAEELEGLKVQLASEETFERYGIDRPLFLMRLEFSVVERTQSGQPVVRVRSTTPVTEPFVTFLVEASWASGRLLREYTVLLDPPTFAAPPVASSPQAMTAPRSAAPRDSAAVERQPETVRRPSSAPESSASRELYVERGDTLWEIASRARADNRLSMNQMMLAIYEANPQAFSGNLNRLNAGVTLTIPSTDDIFRISRGDALSEVQRQNAAWNAGDRNAAQPSLTLVPPDGEQSDLDRPAPRTESSSAADAAMAARLRDLEATVAEQNSLIEIRNNELAQLHEELARLREAAASAEAGAQGPGVADTDSQELFVDDEVAPVAEAPAEDAAPAVEAQPAESRPSAQVVSTQKEPGLITTLFKTAGEALTSFWGILGGVLLLVIGILAWLAKRTTSDRSDEESTGVWEALDSEEEIDSESRASTERLRALARDEDNSIVVVEQDRGRRRSASDEMDVEGEAQPAIEDTFSSETAINLDQTDPVAEADFHMAYGLYDQAADLVNGALEADPGNRDLLSKLCEIYFVWGNRDAFVDAASRLREQVGEEGSPDWDKIVIMGQQIAGDHKLFSGISAGGASRAVDLSFDSDEGKGALDMDFDSDPDSEAGEIIDFGGENEEEAASADYSGLDFVFDAEPEAAASSQGEGEKQDLADDVTVESPALSSADVERPLDEADGTSELPSITDSDGYKSDSRGDATTEIDLDDLGLDLDALAKTGLDVDLDDADEEAANSDFSEIDDTSENRALGSDPEKDDAAGHADEVFDLDNFLDETSEVASFDETGRNPALSEFDDTGTDVNTGNALLDATGRTQVLSGDFGVNTTTGNAGSQLEDDDKTTLSPAFGYDSADATEDGDEQAYEATAALNADELDVDFAKTEALPKGVFGNDESSDETDAGGDDLDLDFGDLTTAMGSGDTVDQPRDEETVEQPVVRGGGKSHQFLDLDLGEFSDDDGSATAQLSPDDLPDAHTMTEAGTKLDLARAYVDMGDPDGARSILEEVLDEGDDGQKQQAQNLIDTLPA